jgi:MFS family permease
LNVGLSPEILGYLLSTAFVARFLSFGLILAATSHLHSPDQTLIMPKPQDSHVPILPICVAIFFFRFSVNTSSPFYSAFMLKELSMTFPQYLFLTAVPLISKIISLHNWARMLDHKRIFEALVLSTVIVSLVPILWSAYHATAWLAVLQVLSGLSWSGFELVSVLLIQQMYPGNITQRLGIFLAAGSLGSVFGGVAGGALLNDGYSYTQLFTLSGWLRLGTGMGLLLYLRKQHLFRFQHLKLREGVITIVALRPSVEAMIKLVPLKPRRVAVKARHKDAA